MHVPLCSHFAHFRALKVKPKMILGESVVPLELMVVFTELREARVLDVIDWHFTVTTLVNAIHSIGKLSCVLLLSFV